MNALNPDPHKRLHLKVADGIRFIPHEEIIRIESHDKKVWVYISSNDQPVEGYNKLEDIEKQLDTSAFFCCHWSHIVNLKHIIKYVSKTSELVTTQGTIPRSERRVNQFKTNIMQKI